VSAYNTGHNPQSASEALRRKRCAGV